MILWRKKKISLSIKSKISAASWTMLVSSRNNPNMQIRSQVWTNLRATTLPNKRKSRRSQWNKKRSWKKKKMRSRRVGSIIKKLCLINRIVLTSRMRVNSSKMTINNRSARQRKPSKLNYRNQWVSYHSWMNLKSFILSQTLTMPSRPLTTLMGWYSICGWR